MASSEAAKAKEAEAGAPGEIDDATKDRLEDAFRDWHAIYGHALDLGGTGNVYELFLTLEAAFKNTSITELNLQDRGDTEEARRNIDLDNQ